MILNLQAGKWQASVCPNLGMNLCSLSFDGHPILRAPSSEQALKDNLYLFGNPLLFPSNRTENGRFSFQDTLYTLPINEPLHNNNLHGLMADAPFSVLSKTEREISAVYHNRKERYPFEFDMVISDNLSDHGWERRVKLTALEDMPFTLAFHTTFIEPNMFSVPVGRCFLRNEHHIPTGKTAPAKPFGKAISGFFEAAGHIVSLDEFIFHVSDNFDQWIVFNGGGNSGFLCIEPQCGGVNGLNTVHHHILGMGDSEEFTLTITRKACEREGNYY